MDTLYGKIQKFLGSDYFIVALLVLVAFGSFGLGKLSNDTATPEITISYLDNSPTTSPETLDAYDTVIKGEVLGSVNGTKYHFPWCGGAARIKEENKVWFKNVQDAKERGYSRALNCKGLE